MKADSSVCCFTNHICMLVSILWENYKFQQWIWWRITSLCDKNLLSLYNFKLYRNKAVTNTALYLYNLPFNVKCFWGKKGHKKGRYAINLYENLPVSWEYQDVTCHWAMLGAEYFLKIWTLNYLLTSYNGNHLHTMHILTYILMWQLDKRALQALWVDNLDSDRICANILCL